MAILAEKPKQNTTTTLVAIAITTKIVIENQRQIAELAETENSDILNPRQTAIFEISIFFKQKKALN